MPIDNQINEILKSVRASANVILTATPGAGKTTRLPPELLKTVQGKVLVLQPRRMAAVGACDRVASEQGWTVGDEVGYQVRFESRVKPSTRLIYMTDALLLRQMISDPELKGVDLVILDEFHERSLNQDLLLILLRELQELRDLKIIIMSATLGTEKLLRYLPKAVHVDVPGKVFPLDIRYSQDSLSLRTDYDFYDRVVGAIQRADQETRGDILVFLPGTGEISRVEERLHGLRRGIFPLHGSLPLNEQRAILKPASEPRVILATNVAEASVTVPGVDFVIDSGLSKVMRTHPESGFSQLELGRISLFNARQRSGRAAREKSGVSLRLWTSHEEVTQPEEVEPEALRADLSSALLTLSFFGVTDFASAGWLDYPGPARLDGARKSLLRLGALESSGAITALGRRLMEFPLPPRLGALLVTAESMGCGELGARVAAILNERDFVLGEATTAFECDIRYRLDLLEDFRAGRKPGGVNHAGLVAVDQAARQYARLVSAGSGGDLSRLLLLSQRDRLCRRRGSTARALMMGGRGVKLDPRSQVRKSEFFVALGGVDLAGQSETTVSLASGFSKDLVLSVLKDSISVSETVEFIEEKSAFFAQRVRLLDGFALEEPNLAPVEFSKIQDRIGEVLFAKWAWVVSKNPALTSWMARWNFMQRAFPEYVLGEDKIREALSLAAFGKTKLDAVVAENLVGFLEMGLDPAALRFFHAEVPRTFVAPSGVEHAIEYGDDAAYVDIRLQEIFGLLKSPKLLSGRVPLIFRLLGPNYRPVQVTSDLESFWRSGYLEVRKELRLRYPKHSWPDDPLTARPEAKGRRRN